MSQYRYDEMEDFSRSANRLRQEMEDRLRQEEYQRYLQELDKSSKGVVGPAEKMIERQIRKTINSDEVGRELRNTALAVGLVGSVAAGIALCVASCASDSAYNSSMEKAMKDYETDRQNSFTRAVDDGMNIQTQSLAEYNNRVAEKRQELENAQNAYYVEYRETRQEALTAISAAKDTYNQEKAAIASGYKAADETRTREINAANDHYSKEVDRIKSEYPEGADRDRELTRAAERRDTEIQRTETNHRNEVQQLKDRTVTAETNLNNVVNHQKDIISEAQIKRDTSIASAKTELSNAQVQLSSFQKSMSSREDMEKTVMSMVNSGGSGHDNIGGAHNIAVKDANTRKEIMDAGREAARAALFTGNLTATSDHIKNALDNARFNAGSTQEERFANAIMSNHKNIGLSIAEQLGSQEERALLSKCASYEQQMKDYKVACDNAARNGLPEPPVPKSPVTKEEIAQANRIVDKYSGSLNSEKDLAQTIHVMKKSANELTKQNEGIQAKIQKDQGQLASLNSKIKAAETDLATLKNIHVALEKGQLNGVKLTPEQRKDLMAKAQSLNAAGLRNELLSLQQQKKGVVNAIDANKKIIAKNNGTIQNIKEHTNRLTLHGKAILATAKRSQPVTLFGGILKDDKGGALIKLKYKDKNGNTHYITKKAKDSNKSANKMQKKGISMIFGSIGKISREVKRDLHKGNALQNELMKNARAANQFARKYDLAIGIGSFAIKAMRGVTHNMGKGFGKVGSKIFKKIGGENTRLGKMLKGISGNEKFKKFVKVGKITKNSGLAIGGKLLKAPSAILKAPMKLMNAPQELAKGTVKVAWRTTRKVTGVTVKGAKKVTKTVAKHTIGKTKFGQKISKMFGSVSNKFKAFKQSLARFNPINFVKKKIAALISSLLSGLSSLASWFFMVLGYIVAAAGIASLIIIAVLLLLALLVAVVDAIINWFKSLGAQSDTYVRTQPNFIMNMTVNYRYEELQILANANNSKLIPTSKPIETYNMSKWLFSIMPTTKEGIKNLAYNEIYESSNNSGYGLIKYQNDSAYYQLNKLGISFNESYSLTDNFAGFVSHYDNINVQYYKYSDIGDDGKLKSTAVASQYEISNAKDVMAMVDTIYDHKANDGNSDEYDMQVHEVLAYLGVGDYQQEIEYKDGDEYDSSLFYLTHKILYGNGTSSSGIKYHATVKSATNSNNYVVDNNKLFNYQGQDKYSVVGGASSACDAEHQKTLSLTYTKTTTTYRSPHTDQNNYNWNYRHEYEVDSSVMYNVTKSDTALTPMEIYYYAHSDANGGYFNGTYSPYYYTDYPLTVSEITRSSNGRSVSITLSDIATNTLAKNDATSLYNMLDDPDYDCTVFFYLKTGNTYRVVDSSGYYLGTYTFSGKSMDAITKYSVGDSSYTTSKLEAFFMVWDSYNEEFYYKIVGYTNGRYTYGPNSNVSICGGSSFTYKLPYFAGRNLKASCYCEKIAETKEETIPFTYTYCIGHLDLDVKIAVSTIDDGNLIFEQARKLGKFDKWSKSEQDSFMGIVIYSDDDYASGWGSYTLYGFDPDTYWKSDGEYRKTAKAKASVDFDYEVEEKDGNTLSQLVISIDGKFDSLSKTSDNKLLYGIYYGGNTYYVKSYTSGEQKQLQLYKNGNISYVSFFIENGKFVPRTVSAPLQ